MANKSVRERLAVAMRTAWHSGRTNWWDMADVAFEILAPAEPMPLPAESDRLITMTIAIGRNGDVYQDTQTHGNSWGEVYRGTHGIKEEIHRLIADQRSCPLHPKKGA